jgi:succinate dehydrogenase / fumarate reductase iron-sulfur subunit
VTAPVVGHGDGHGRSRRLRLTVRVWRQAGPDARGAFEEHRVDDATPEMSVLELLDRLNAGLVADGGEPVAFDSDCREGICGACGCVVNGTPHGPADTTPVCLQRLWRFADGDVIVLEPFRAAAFPVVRDLVVDRSALDRIIAAGGYVSVATGEAPAADAVPVGHDVAEAAMDAAACIGCGACVAACPNAAATLFTSAKVAHLALMPQGAPERDRRVAAMVAVQEEHFGACSNIGECVPACPAEITLASIARMNRELLRARWRRRFGLRV